MKNRKCLIIANTAKSESGKIADEIRSHLAGQGVSADIFLFPAQHESNPFSGYDFAVTLGGDGTVLFAARGCAPLGIPVFPVNLGEFGFIAGIQKGEHLTELDRFLSGEMGYEKRGMIEASIVRMEGRTQKTLCTVNALNDMVIRAKEAMRIIALDISCDGNSFGRFKADAVIAATPTGSTAYSAAAGGPIIDPALAALVLTPVSPFSLSSRPIVLSSESVLSIACGIAQPCAIPQVMLLLADGQPVHDIAPNDVVIIKKAEHDALLAGFSSAAFYKTLRAKMNWSGAPLSFR